MRPNRASARFVKPCNVSLERSSTGSQKKAPLTTGVFARSFDKLRRTTRKRRHVVALVEKLLDQQCAKAATSACDQGDALDDLGAHEATLSFLNRAEC